MPDPISNYVSKPFRPDAETLSRLLADLTDSDLTLRQIARDFHTDLVQLHAFLATSPALTEAHHAAALRIRLAAAAQLPEVLTTLLTMVRTYQSDAGRLRPDTPENRIRLEEHARDARRAAHLLFRLANYNPRPLRIRATDIPLRNSPSDHAAPRDVGAAAPAAPHPTEPDSSAFHATPNSSASPLPLVEPHNASSTAPPAPSTHPPALTQPAPTHERGLQAAAAPCTSGNTPNTDHKPPTAIPP